MRLVDDKLDVVERDESRAEDLQRVASREAEDDLDDHMVDLILTSRGGEGIASEPQMKAAFLVNFPKYVDWPAKETNSTNTPIVVAIFGDDKVVNEFLEMIQGGRVINGRPLALKRIISEDEIKKDCEILFIGASERHRIPAILEKVKGASILTVSESEDFLDRGGVIKLIRKERNIRLGINLNAAGQARLRISSNLLSVADVVKGKPN